MNNRDESSNFEAVKPVRLHINSQETETSGRNLMFTDAFSK